jgi:hypothetical protein
MTLYLFQHARRLGTADEARRLYEALGEKQVQVYGWKTTDVAQIGRMVAALPERERHSLSFEGGTLSAAAREALAVLVLRPYDYLDVRSGNANLRCWPAQRSWVHAQASAAALGQALGQALGPNGDLPASPFVLGELTGSFHGDGRHYPVDIETRTPQPAWRVFAALSVDALDRGFISGARRSSHDPLLAFLTASRAEVTLDAVLPAATASALVSHAGQASGNFQAGGAMVTFPDGAITGSLTRSNDSEANRKKWHARIDKALRRAGL